MKPALSGRASTLPDHRSWRQLHRVAALLLIGVTTVLSVDADHIGRCAENGRAPNIVLILADDLGYADLGCYGGEIATPNIDRLAAEGLRFTQFYNCAMCGPTRAALATGQHPQRMGVKGWSDKRNEQSISIAEALHAAGYTTICVGSWPDAEVGRDHGFDRFFGYRGWGPGSYFHAVRCGTAWRDFEPFEIPREGFYRPEADGQHAEQYLKEAIRAGKPFFLYLAGMAPHWPLHAREEDIAPYRQTYRAGWDELRGKRLDRQRALGLLDSRWPKVRRDERVPAWSDAPHKAWEAERMAVYAAQVTCLDRNVGRVLKVLDDARVADNTLVMFLSDNGASDQGGYPADRLNRWEGKDQTWRLDGTRMRAGNNPAIMPGPADTFVTYGPAWAQLSNTPFRQYKLTNHEGGISTPLVVRWPAVIRKGGMTGQIGHVIDILPTCLEAARAEYPREFRGRQIPPADGASLMPIFTGGQRQAHAVLGWLNAGHRAVRVGKWKLASLAGQPWELYDIEADRTEMHDLAAEQPERVAEMSQAYAEWAKRVAPPPRPR
jgi:arylsulfatase A-like enzyme